MSLLAQAVVAPVRLGAQHRTLNDLCSEPLLFAAHYAYVADRLARLWPDDLARLIDRVAKRYRPHDAALELMDTLRGQFPAALSIDLARRIAEGLELHTQLRDRPERYQQACQDYLARIGEISTGEEGDETDFAGRLNVLCRILDLTPGESRLLAMAAALASSIPLQLLSRLASDLQAVRAPYWQGLLDMDAAELMQVVSPSGRLVGSGLLTVRDGLPRLPEFWVILLLVGESGLHGGLLQTLTSRESTGGAARLPEDDRNILHTLLGQRQPGINVLLYGKASVDKTRLAQSLVAAAGGTAYTLVADIPEPDQPAAVLVGQRLLAKASGHPVLVVEKAAAVLTRTRPELMFFGLVDEDEEAALLDERLLTGNPVPTLWLAHDAQRLHRDTVTRFLFHAEALKGTRADREALVESVIAQLPISAKEKAELAKLEGLSVPQLLGARILAQMTAGASRTTFARHFRIAAQRSQKALARRGRDEARLPVTHYSLDYINAAGRFGPTHILKAFRQRPHGSLCLYGLPGTGKTQYAEYLAQSLGLPLLIKRASELLDKYVGESEKRIAEAFDAAEEEGALLLLDEADSFLRDRARSTHTWEVTTVNELLQRMERFEGIFVCTTNLYDQLDTAALRRFTFKLEFLALTLDQRWEMFLNETELRGKSLSEKRRTAWEDRLMLMQNLTAGDFATVKRQCVLLGETLSPEAWLEQLEIEVRAKSRTKEAVAT